MRDSDDFYLEDDQGNELALESCIAKLLEESGKMRDSLGLKE